MVIWPHTSTSSSLCASFRQSATWLFYTYMYARIKVLTGCVGFWTCKVCPAHVGVKVCTIVYSPTGLSALRWVLCCWFPACLHLLRWWGGKHSFPVSQSDAFEETVGFGWVLAATCARPPLPSLPMCLPNLFACSVLGCEEAYIVSGLMSYARAYWRKATKKNTGGDVPCLNIHTYMCHAQLFYWYRLFLSTNMRARPMTTLGCKQVESCHARKSPPRSTLLPEKNNWWFGCRGSCKWTSWWGWNLFSTVCWRFGHAALFFHCLLNLVSHTSPGPWSQAWLMSSMTSSHGLQRSSPPWRRRHQSTLLHGWCSFVHDFWKASRIELPEGTETQWCIYIQLLSVAHNHIQLYRQLMIHKNIL